MRTEQRSDIGTGITSPGGRHHDENSRQRTGLNTGTLHFLRAGLRRSLRSRIPFTMRTSAVPKKRRVAQQYTIIQNKIPPDIR